MALTRHGCHVDAWTVTDAMAALLADERVLGRRIAELIIESDAVTRAMLASLIGRDCRLVDSR